MSEPIYQRVLLKLSGEALLGDADYGIVQVLRRIAGEIREVSALGVQLAVVIGGGNIFRGEGLARSGMDRVTGDQMGMLATVINALAMQDALEALGLYRARHVGDPHQRSLRRHIRRRAVRHLEKGRITIFAAGTGNPFFTTDTRGGVAFHRDRRPAPAQGDQGGWSL